MEELETFIHERFNEKYKLPLNGLNLAMYNFMKLLKGILLHLQSLIPLVGADKAGLSLVHNCM